MRRRMEAGRDFTYTPFGAQLRSREPICVSLLLLTCHHDARRRLCKTLNLENVTMECTKIQETKSPIMYDTTICFPEGVALDDATEPKLGSLIATVFVFSLRRLLSPRRRC